jgi:hypothetical protein
MKRFTWCFLLLGILIGNVPNACCDSPDQGWESVGLRTGFSATSRKEFFHKDEIYVTHGLPWSLRADSGWGVAWQLDTAAGALYGGGEVGMIGTVGPTVILNKTGNGLAFEFGGDLCGLSRYSYGNVNLNGHLLFQGQAGLLYTFDCGPGIGYRFQHISNGGLAIGGYGTGNTGVDLHMLDLSWNFH